MSVKILKGSDTHSSTKANCYFITQLDLSSAFMAEHSILKGVSDITLKWLIPYLSKGHLDVPYPQLTF